MLSLNAFLALPTLIGNDNKQILIKLSLVNNGAFFMRFFIFLFLTATIVYPQTIKYQNPLLPFIFFNTIDMYEEDAHHLALSDSSYIFSSFNINQIYLEKNGSKIVKDFGYWNFASGINSALLIAGRKYYFQYSFEKNKKFLISNANSDKLQFTREFNADKFFLKTPFFWDALSLNTYLRKQNIADLEYRLGFSLLTFDNLEIQYGFGRFNNDWKMQTSNANGDIDIELKENKKIHDIKASWDNQNIKVSASYSDAAINKDVNIKNGAVAMPIGSERLLNLSTSLHKLLGMNEWYFNYTNFNSKSKGLFYNDKEKFGELTRKKSSYQSYSLGLSKSFNLHKVAANIALGQSNFAVNGSMDTGPFGDFWLGFLGLRNLIKSKLDYRHISSSIKYAYTFNQKLTWDFGLAHEFIKTDDASFLRTWQAEIIIPRNIRFFDLGAEQQHGLYIDARISYNVFANVLLQYEISQYIPIDTDSGSGGSTAAKNKNFIYGGGQHLLHLQIVL